MMKKFIKLFLTAMCIISIITIYGKSNSIAANDLFNHYTELMKAQENAKKSYEKLTETFYTNESNIQYPDEYAGAYIEDNKLFIRLAGASEDKKKEYYELLNDFNCVEIIEASYSLNYLNELELNLESQINSLSPTSYGVDPISNSIVIKVPSENLEEAYSEFNTDTKRNSKPSPITIEEDNEYSRPEASDLIGGDRIQHNGSNYTMSIGGGAYGNKAILFCGHGTSVTSSVSVNGTVIGNVVAKQFANNQVGDYAIATVTNSNFNTTNLVKGDSQNFAITGLYSNPAVGTLLYKYGQGTNGVCAVTVTATNQTKAFFLDGTTYNIKGLTSADIVSGSSSAGDSGGPYYSWYNNGWAYSGVHSASNSSSTTFTPLANITGFTPRTN